MKSHQASDAYYLLTFFVVVIFLGSWALCLPNAWMGVPGYQRPIAYIDALFTAASAVCVTGLITVDTAGFSLFGQTVIMALIQVGGLGIISFTSILLTIPGGRLPLRRLRTIQSFYVDGVEFDPKKIVRSIVFFTLLIESAGAGLLYMEFKNSGVSRPAFAAVFHSISAFCNAGFSVFSPGLRDHAENAAVLGTISVLIVLGGIGFIVIQDIERCFRGKRRKLSYHSRVVLGMTAFLIIFGAIAFWLLERNGAYGDLGLLDTVMNALFQSITPRTAGFDSVLQSSLSQPSKVLTILLMFIGGAPGSIAGGIKVTTAFVVAIVMLRRPNARGDIAMFRRSLSSKTTNDAVVYFLKAAALLMLSAGALSLIEGLRGVDFSVIVFESVSAFGTVGLSLGLTPELSAAGKLVIIGTMFAGRVGLIAIAFPGAGWRTNAMSYPQGNILLG
ncbi:MAG: hypothetical protein A2Z99_15330 [Treponema sp. GWB1_62_6]|nr:MAG: hypothetical protein A2Y36_04070 [Treponema sp. GWA1_62_8]OHE68111.1 MAG: hypothetical protein A2Z99_15330 [Treponema sp. GWB1_62_6]OHE68664.1 MAG: hypothetical protein A2001_06045 [Treponema sp. GWC1_61_84]OHE70358.1 MAG: hypothetical protein A2413_15095 [Treponema sp. RIFOXYC1_FULL_61_9]HCM26617.1 potassium transporter [Treponema sp.]